MPERPGNSSAMRLAGRVGVSAAGELSGVFVVFACAEAHNPVTMPLTKSIFTHLPNISAPYEPHVNQRARHASSPQRRGVAKLSAVRIICAGHTHRKCLR